MFGKRMPKKPEVDHKWSAQQLREARMEIDKVLAGIDAGTIDKEECEFCLSSALSNLAKAWHFWDMTDDEFSGATQDAVGWHLYSIPNLCPFQFNLVHPEATYETRDEFPPVG
ncbi:MAG: hypothetical protein ACTS3F_12420 [Phycisphaerales bacterium]